MANIDNSPDIRTAAPPPGQGIVDMKFYPIWQKLNIQAQMNGQEFPQYSDWLRQQMAQGNAPQPVAGY
jgi:hypothetical protein